MTVQVRTVGVIGGGQMGGGIAQVAAQVGKLNVILVDLDDSKLKKSMDFMGM